MRRDVGIIGLGLVVLTALGFYFSRSGVAPQPQYQNAISTFEVLETQVGPTAPPTLPLSAISLAKPTVKREVFLPGGGSLLLRIPDSLVFNDSDTVAAIVLGYATTTWYSATGVAQSWKPYTTDPQAINCFTSRLTPDYSIGGFVYLHISPLHFWTPQFPLASRDRFTVQFTPFDTFTTVVDEFYPAGKFRTYNFILLFLLGGLSFMAIVFGLLYLRSRNQVVFGAYGIYLLAQVVYWCTVVPAFGIEWTTNLSTYFSISVFSQLVFHVSYIVFTTELLEFGKYRPWIKKILDYTRIVLICYAGFLALGMLFRVDVDFLANTFTVERILIGLLSLGLAAHVVIWPENTFYSILGVGTIAFVGGALLTMAGFGIIPFVVGVVAEMICFTYAIGIQVERNLKKQVNSQKKAFALEREVMRTKDAALRAQMNPHFVSNVINALRALILEEKNADAYLYMTRFAHLVRVMLGSTERAVISVAEEINLLRDYVVLEGLRFNTEITFSVNIDKQIDDRVVSIPPLILQPIVENAVHHGLVALKARKPRISVFIEQHPQRDHLQAVVIDNGVGREAARITQAKRIRKRPSMALNIIVERLQLIETASSPPQEYMTFEDLYNNQQEPIGTKVSLLIPIQRLQSSTASPPVGESAPKKV